MLVWNVRGLNMRARRNVVRESVSNHRIHVACLQETKLDVIPPSTVLELMGSGFDYYYLPLCGASGGVLIAWRTDVWTGSMHERRQFTVTMRLESSLDPALHWWLTSVMVPSSRPTNRRSWMSFAPCAQLSLVHGW